MLVREIVVFGGDKNKEKIQALCFEICRQLAIRSMLVLDQIEGCAEAVRKNITKSSDELEAAIENLETAIHAYDRLWDEESEIPHSLVSFRLDYEFSSAWDVICKEARRSDNISKHPNAPAHVHVKRSMLRIITTNKILEETGQLLTAKVLQNTNSYRSEKLPINCEDGISKSELVVIQYVVPTKEKDGKFVVVKEFSLSLSSFWGDS